MEALGKISGVTHISQSLTPNSYALEIPIGEDVREELTNLVVTRGVGLLELTTQPVSLEDVFKVLTKTEKQMD